MSTQSVVIAITAKSQGVDAELKKTKDKFDNLNKSILGDKAQDAVKGMQKSLGGLSSVGDSLGGVFKNIVGGFTSMLSPIGLATAAIGGLITMGVNLYKKLTLSNEEYIDYLNHSMQNSKERLSKVENQDKTDTGYFERLKQLNQTEKVSNAIKTESIILIQLLTRRYGDLGISIDETTGKIIGLDTAFNRFQQRINQLKLSELNTQAEIAKNKVAALEKEVSPYNNVTTSYKLENAKTYDEFMTPEEKKKFNSGNRQQRKQAMESANRRAEQQFAKFKAQNTSAETQSEYKRILQQIKALEKKQQESGLNTSDMAEYQELEKKAKGLQKVIDLEFQLFVAQKKIKETASDPDTNKKWKEFAIGVKQAIDAQKQANIQMEKQQNGQIGRRERALALANQQMKLGIKIKDAERQTDSYKKQTKLATQQYNFSRKDKAQRIQFYDQKMAKETSFQTLTSEVVSNQKSGIDSINSKYGEMIAQLEKKQREKTITDDEKRTLDMYKTIFGNRISAYQETVANYKNIMSRYKKAVEEFEKTTGKKESQWTSQQKLQFAKFNAPLLDQMQRNYTSQIVQNTDYDKLKQEQQKLQDKQKNGPLTASEFDKLLEINKQIIIIETAIAETKKLQASTVKNITELEIKRKQIVDELNDTFTNGNKELDRQLQLQQRILEGDLKAIERQKVLNALKAKGYDPENLKKQGIDVDKQVNTYVDKKMDLESKKYFTSQTKAIEKQIEMQKLILQGKFDQIERQKIINDLKAKGAKIDEKEVDALLSKKKALSALQFQGDIKSQAQSLYDNLNSQINRKQAEIEKRTRQAEEKYGTLTDEQKDKIVKVVGLEFQLEKLTNAKPNYNPRQIETNELTRRGGFASGYVMFNQKDEVNKQIKTITEKQAALLKQIKDLISDGSRIP